MKFEQHFIEWLQLIFKVTSKKDLFETPILIVNLQKTLFTLKLRLFKVDLEKSHFVKNSFFQDWFPKKDFLKTGTPYHVCRSSQNSFTLWDILYTQLTSTRVADPVTSGSVFV